MSQRSRYIGTLDFRRGRHRPAVDCIDRFDQCFQSLDVGRSQDLDYPPEPCRDDEPLVLDDVNRHGRSAHKVPLGLLHAGQKLQIGKILGLDEFRLLRILTKDAQHAARLLVVVKGGEISTQAAIGPQFYRRELLGFPFEIHRSRRAGRHASAVKQQT